jgi:hypothetical protein
VGLDAEAGSAGVRGAAQHAGTLRLETISVCLCLTVFFSKFFNLSALSDE